MYGDHHPLSTICGVHSPVSICDSHACHAGHRGEIVYKMSCCQIPSDSDLQFKFLASKQMAGNIAFVQEPYQYWFLSLGVENGTKRYLDANQL